MSGRTKSQVEFPVPAAVAQQKSRDYAESENEYLSMVSEPGGDEGMRKKLFLKPPRYVLISFGIDRLRGAQ